MLLFMVPDDSGKPSGADDMLDTSETSRAAQKVDLDLDDAPFLDEEEEVKQEAPPKQEAVGTEEPAEAPPKRDKKKLIIIGAAALVLLIGAGIAVRFLFFKPKPKPVEAPPAVEEPQDNGTEDAKAEIPETMYRLEPFWVEQKGAKEDEVRFLIVRMLLGAKDPGAVKELEGKLLPARNAIFYYLKNKDVQFLADEDNTEKLRKELLLVVNQYVADTKFDTLLFEEYVVK